jgi:hypothetical protein
MRIVPLICGQGADSVWSELEALFEVDTPAAVQVTMPPHAAFSGPNSKTQIRLDKAQADAQKLRSLRPSFFILDHEVPPAEKPMRLQARDYDLVSIEAERRGMRPKGGYQVPWVTKNSTLRDYPGDMAAAVMMRAQWVCPSTYRKDDRWRDISPAIELARRAGLEVVPYVSGQAWGRSDHGELVTTGELVQLRKRLAIQGIRQIILWVDTGWGGLAVTGAERVLEAWQYETEGATDE